MDAQIGLKWTVLKSKVDSPQIERLSKMGGLFIKVFEMGQYMTVHFQSFECRLDLSPSTLDLTDKIENYF